MTPPCFAPNANNRIDFKDHSPDFEVLGRELLSVLNIFLTAMDDRGEAPVRWNWNYELLKRCELLDSTDVRKKLLANLICLILSQATRDHDCIGGTEALHKAGLLDIEALAKADLSTIEQCIVKCGIVGRAKAIQEMAQIVLEKHGGVVPSDYNTLMSLSCVGRKTTLLYGHRDLWILHRHTGG